MEFSEVQREDGSSISRVDLIVEYIASNRIQEAFLQVNLLKYKLSFYEFEQVSNWFIQLLKEQHANNPSTISDHEIDSYQQKLNALL